MSLLSGFHFVKGHKDMLLIIRGAPGSGKTTKAKKMKTAFGFKHVEADMFFEKDGKYLFEKDKVRLAHKWCQQLTFKFLSEGKDVVVANTFTKLWEIAAYTDFCKQNDIYFEVVELFNDYGNVHNVPEEVVQRMREQFEPFNTEE